MATECSGAPGRLSESCPGGWETAPTPGLSTVSPHNVNIQLHLEVPRVLFGPGGWSTAPSPGMSAIDPSTPHTPTTITSPLILEPGIAEDAGEIRSVAVWTRVSGRVASDASVSWFDFTAGRDSEGLGLGSYACPG